jgi:hypothetical protein
MSLEGSECPFIAISDFVRRVKGELLLRGTMKRICVNLQAHFDKADSGTAMVALCARSSMWKQSISFPVVFPHNQHLGDSPPNPPEIPALTGLSLATRVHECAEQVTYLERPCFGKSQGKGTWSACIPNAGDEKSGIRMNRILTQSRAPFQPDFPGRHSGEMNRGRLWSNVGNW